MFDVATGADVIPPLTLDASAARVVFSADDRTLFATDRAGGVRMLDLASDPRGKETARLALADPSILVSPDGTTLAGFDRAPNEIDLFDRDGKLVRTLKPPLDFITRAAFTSDSRRLALGGFVRGKGRAKDGVHLVIELSTGAAAMSSRTPGTWAQSIAISSDGARLVTGCTDGTSRLFDVATGAQVQSTRVHDGPVTAIAISADGEWIASGGADHVITMQDGRTGQAVRSFPAHAGVINCLAFASDGERLASGASDGLVKVWEHESGTQTNSLPGHVAAVACVATHGAIAATGGFDGAVIFWNLGDGKATRAITPQRGPVLDASFARDGATLAAALQAGSVLLTDGAGGDERFVEDLGAPAIGVDFAPDGKRLVVACGDDVARIVDVATRAITATLRVDRGTLHCVAWSPDGRTIAFGTSEVHLFDAATGRLRRTCAEQKSPIAALRFLPDGKRVAAACADERVRIYTIENGAVAAVLPVAPSKSAGGGRVQALAISADGATMATGSANENIVRLFDAAALAPLPRGAELAGHAAPVRALAFTDDGRLVSGAGDTLAILWKKLARD